MLKLYKRMPDHVAYWETWDKEGQTCVHIGRVGQHGNSLWFPPEQREALAARLERDIAKLREQGYAELAPSDLAKFVLRYEVSTGATIDAARQQRLEDLLDESLGWTANGQCAALETIVAILRRESWLTGAVMAAALPSQSDYQVLWPAGSASEFSLT
jgi:hypothetical protein